MAVIYFIVSARLIRGRPSKLFGETCTKSCFGVCCRGTALVKRWMEVMFSTKRNCILSTALVLSSVPHFQAAASSSGIR